MTMTNPIFCAIDRADVEGAVRLTRALRGAVGGVKLGLEFVTASGPDGVRQVAAHGLPVFLDLKFHDIPNTVAGAVRSAAGLEVAMLTVHAAGGRAMLQAAVAAARDLPARPLLLGVTVLTSLDDDDLQATGVRAPVADQVMRLAELAVNAGLDGLVCSPHEIEPLRSQFGTAVRLVVPGIRPAGSVGDDQRRTLSPREAIARGADVLVIGRPITAAPEPRAAARGLVDEIERARAA